MVGALVVLVARLAVMDSDSTLFSTAFVIASAAAMLVLNEKVSEACGFAPQRMAPWRGRAGGMGKGREEGRDEGREGGMERSRERWREERRG